MDVECNLAGLWYGLSTRHDIEMRHILKGVMATDIIDPYLVRRGVRILGIPVSKSPLTWPAQSAQVF